MYVPKAHTLFIPTEQKFLYIAHDGAYSSPAIVTRKTVKHNNNWIKELNIKPSIPLIEDTNPQIIPITNGYASTLQHIWEQSKQHQWNKYKRILSKFFRSVNILLLTF